MMVPIGESHAENRGYCGNTRKVLAARMTADSGNKHRNTGVGRIKKKYKEKLVSHKPVKAFKYKIEIGMLY